MVETAGIQVEEGLEDIFKKFDAKWNEVITEKAIEITVDYKVLGQGSLISDEIVDLLAGWNVDYTIKMIPSDQKLILTMRIKGGK